MGTIIGFLAIILYVVSAVCGIIILVHAFNTELVQGLLCFCVPFYILYYAFTQYDSENKGLILGGWLGGGVIAVVMQMIAAAMAVAAVL